MERLDWRNCKQIDFIADTSKDYDYIIELVDMPFEKGQQIIFESESGDKICEILKIKSMKIYIKVLEEM
jgi:hypothetical protein